MKSSATEKAGSQSRKIHVGRIAIGGSAPVSVQTMTKTDTRDIDATVKQVNSVAAIGCDIVRLAVVDSEAATALAEIKNQTEIPLIADIHFDHRLALTAIESGVDGLRINPGNIGSEEKVAEIVSAARPRSIPIRIGVNSGSLEKDIYDKFGGVSPAALVESALRHVSILEKLDYREIKISVKASNAMETVQAYRLLARQTDYPLHLGVTEAGTFLTGTVRSCAALAILLAEGIGDTIRISLTDQPEREVKVGIELLRALGLRERGPSIISCPTCGRVQVDVIDMAEKVEQELEKLQNLRPDVKIPLVAVMGCMVNGPGEAKEAEIALAGGKNKYALYVEGELKCTVSEEKALEILLDEVNKRLNT